MSHCGVHYLNMLYNPCLMEDILQIDSRQLNLGILNYNFPIFQEVYSVGITLKQGTVNLWGQQLFLLPVLIELVLKPIVYGLQCGHRPLRFMIQPISLRGSHVTRECIVWIQYCFSVLLCEDRKSSEVLWELGGGILRIQCGEIGERPLKGR